MPLEYMNMIWVIGIITIASIVLLPLLAWVLTSNDQNKMGFKPRPLGR